MSTAHVTTTDSLIEEVRLLRAENATQRERITALEEVVKHLQERSTKLEGENAALEERVQQLESTAAAKV